MHFESTKPYDFYQSDTDRDRLQLLFDHSFNNGDKSSLRKHYIFLRQLELNSFIDFPLETVNISALAESVTMGCDILLSQMGMSFIFCGNETTPAVCNQRFVTKALLNLLSNAYLFGSEKLVTVKTVESQNFVRIEVQSGGGVFDNTYNKGLQFARDVCLKSNGRFFIMQNAFHTNAIMMFQKSTDYNNAKSTDLYSLISDRLSPLYVELFGMEYHQN